MPAVILNYDARSVKANNLLKFLMSLDFVKITSEDDYFLSEVKEASKEAKKIAAYGALCDLLDYEEGLEDYEDDDEE